MIDYADIGAGLIALDDSGLPAGPFAHHLITRPAHPKDRSRVLFHRPADGTPYPCQEKATVLDETALRGEWTDVRYGLCGGCFPELRERRRWLEAAAVYGTAAEVHTAATRLAPFTDPAARRGLTDDQVFDVARLLFPIARSLSTHPAAQARRALASAADDDRTSIEDAHDLLERSDDTDVTTVAAAAADMLTAADRLWQQAADQRWLETMILDGPLAGAGHRSPVWVAVGRPEEPFPWVPRTEDDATVAVWAAQAPVVAATEDVLVVEAADGLAVGYLLRYLTSARAVPSQALPASDVAAAARIYLTQQDGDTGPWFADVLLAMAATNAG